MSHETAILAGGCFWGMQDLIRKRPGVVATRVGYTGGDVANATYRNHGSHAEGIEIVFDPAVLSYRELLEFFFQIHDPTTPNRQGNDPVSYTHLDVYKRQHQIRPCFLGFRAIEASCTAALTSSRGISTGPSGSAAATAIMTVCVGFSALARAGTKVQVRASAMAAKRFKVIQARPPVINRSFPVSYTHLDVYKRQVKASKKQ